MVRVSGEHKNRVRSSEHVSDDHFDQIDRIFADYLEAVEGNLSAILGWSEMEEEDRKKFPPMSSLSQLGNIVTKLKDFADKSRDKQLEKEAEKNGESTLGLIPFPAHPSNNEV